MHILPVSVGLGLFLATAPVAIGQTVEPLEVRGLGSGTYTRDGKLHLPAGASGKVPAVLFTPGTDGVDQRFDYHRPGLLKAGIAVFEIDTKTGIFTGERDRPKNEFFEPIAFGALKALQSHPRIDAARIGVMGWSAGATTSISVGHRHVANHYLKSDEPRFAAHVGMYGGCSMSRGLLLTGAPVLVLQGKLDTHVRYERCVTFKQSFSNVAFFLYPDIHHGFDKEGINRTTGGRTMRWNKEAAEDARARVLAFFVEVLKPRPAN